MNMIAIALVTMVAGFVQTVTGFGAGIVNMLILPLFLGINVSAGISGMVTLFLNIALVYHYRKYINYQKIVLPIIITMIMSTVAIKIAVILPVNTLKLIFSIFIIILAIYFNFFNGIKLKDNLIMMIICSMIAGVGNGLFGISGPPMVLYYLSACKEKEKYLGTIQTFFLITGLYASLMRLMSGIITMDLLPLIFIGIITCLIGKKIGTVFVDKISDEKMRKLIYDFLGVVGIIKLFECIL